MIQKSWRDKHMWFRPRAKYEVTDHPSPWDIHLSAPFFDSVCLLSELFSFAHLSWIVSSSAVLKSHGLLQLASVRKDYFWQNVFSHATTEEVWGEIVFAIISRPCLDTDCGKLWSVLWEVVTSTNDLSKSSLSLSWKTASMTRRTDHVNPFWKLLQTVNYKFSNTGFQLLLLTHSCIQSKRSLIFNIMT